MKWRQMIVGLVALAAALPPTGGEAQNVWTYRTPAGGWIGITVSYTMRSVGGNTETVVVISDVVEGSPAEDAGILVGDTITLLNGQPVSQELFSSLPETLEPGDLVTVVVEREGTAREFTVEAGPRPQSHIILGPDAERMVVELEAMSGRIREDLDSIRLSIAGLRMESPPGDFGVQILRIPARMGEEGQIGFQFHYSEPFADSLLFGSDVFLTAPEFALPFEAMIVESEEATALKESLAQVGKQLTEVRRESLSRQRALAAALPGSAEEALRNDDAYRELQAKEAEIRARQQDLLTQLRRVSEEEMQRQWLQAQERSEETLLRAREMQEEMEQNRRERDLRARDIYEQFQQQYRSPVIVGQTVLLGAQLKTVTPELAGYFQVEEGVIVLEVIEGSPASEAGLMGGDIITAIAGDSVTSLSDLRFGLVTHEGEEPIRIQVIRKGDPVQILIRR